MLLRADGLLDFNFKTENPVTCDELILEELGNRVKMAKVNRASFLVSGEHICSI